MKIHRHTGLLALLFTLAFSSASAFAASTPLWTLTVPASTLASEMSAVTSVTTDLEGNAFIVITHNTTMDVGGILLPSPLGSQLLLVNKKGQLIASGDFLGVLNPLPLSVTARRVVIQSVGLTALTVGTGGAFVSTNLALATTAEVPTLAGFPPVDRKFVHSAVTMANKVTEIRRYKKLSKLEP